MRAISVDLGNYSVKFLNYNIQKKTIQFIESDEIVIDLEHIEDGSQESIWSAQLEIVKSYLEEIDYEYQLLLNMPSDIATSRFFHLPVKSKKKASLMLPFKVEEDLPYLLSDCHFAESIVLEKEQCHAIVSIVKKESFDIFFDQLKAKSILPKVLTTEVSIFSEYVSSNEISFPESFAIIDIGHDSTNGYFFNHGKIVANHTSYLAGRSITEVISKNYNISMEEAALYKHQNAFLLTEEQYEQVNENQADFARLMDKTIHPLISEIRRWEIGFRVQNGIPVQEVFLCGGSSNIKNIQNYLQSQLPVKVSLFDSFQKMENPNIDTDHKFRRKFAVGSLLSQNSTQSSKLINLLKGDYALQSNLDLPLQSAAFISTRVLIISLLISIIFGIDALFSSMANKKADSQITALLKNPTIKMPPKMKRNTQKKPKATLNRLKRIEKSIVQEIKTIQSSISTNALKNLNDIVHVVSGYNVELHEFSSINDGDFSITLHSKETAQLEELEQTIKSYKGRKFFTDLIKDKKILTISGVEGK